MLPDDCSRALYRMAREPKQLLRIQVAGTGWTIVELNWTVTYLDGYGNLGRLGGIKKCRAGMEVPSCPDINVYYGLEVEPLPLPLPVVSPVEPELLLWDLCLLDFFFELPIPELPVELWSELEAVDPDWLDRSLERD